MVVSLSCVCFAFCDEDGAAIVVLDVDEGGGR